MYPLNARQNRFPGIAALAIAAGLAMNGCMKEDLAGSTSTGNTGKIAGRVVDAGGKGVANAKVRVVATDHNPGPGGAAGEVADVVMTGPDGEYLTDSLADGKYNLLSDKGGLLAFRDSVAVSRSSAVLIDGDTLKAPGSVSGVVRLRPGHDSRTVFLILLGTTTFIVPKDSVGNFKLGPLAEGEYRLRLLSTMDNYRPMDTAVFVRSGVDAVLPDTLRPAYQGSAFGEVPMVDDISLSYDTTMLRATLRWAKSGDSRVAAYNVYRRHKDSGYVRLTVAPTTDTAYTEDWTAGIVPGQTYHYAVTALDGHGNEGLKGKAAVLAMASRFLVEKIEDNYWVNENQFDFDKNGARWQIDEDNKELVQYGSSGEISRFGDSLGFAFGIRHIALDTAGDIYVITATGINNYSTYNLGKYSVSGVRQWQIQLPLSTQNDFLLQGDGEGVSIWNKGPKILTTVGRNGVVLSRDSLSVPKDSLAGYKPGIGFFTLVAAGTNQDSIYIEFRNKDGRVDSTWFHEMINGLSDLDRDSDGRWYLHFYQCVYVFSPQRELLGLVPMEHNGFGKVLWRNGVIYIHDRNMIRLKRILPWH